MKKSIPLLLGLLSLIAVGATKPAHRSGVLDTEKIQQLTGLKGQLDEKEGVFKVSFPRTDLSVITAGAKMTPPMGLTSWAAFVKRGNAVMMMGDTVLLEDQVNPVMSVALENGLEVTALHNHFFSDSPKIMFMHIGGMGSEAELAAAVGKVYTKLRETMGGKGSFPTVDLSPDKTTLDPKIIEQITGVAGTLANGVYKFSVGKQTKMHGQIMGNAMGVNTWAAFIGSDDRALVDGDFAMNESELQSVLKILRGADINVVAIHNHMTNENPRIIFLHYWGVGATRSLASGLKKALDVTHSGK